VADRPHSSGAGGSGARIYRAPAAAPVATPEPAALDLDSPEEIRRKKIAQIKAGVAQFNAAICRMQRGKGT
jgi:hypothetical protein